MAAAVEGLFAPQLRGRLKIHHTPHAMRGQPGSRHWLTLDGEIIWDFPTMFSTERAAELPHIDPDHLVNLDWCWDTWSRDTPRMLGAYLDTPREELFEPIHGDHYGLGNILRAADRRIGFGRVAFWAFTSLSNAPAARAVMGVRFAHLDRPQE